VAVIQISKVQIRRGQTLQTGFPQLSSGELGWSIDTQELYIGNGSVAEGAPAVGNTRILTTNDNFFLIAGNNYIYENTPTSTVVTGPDANYPIIRSIQNKLDDFVTTRDFGAQGNGTTDDTAAIQRAINHASNINKTLYFTEGTFLLSGTLYIPPTTDLKGSGENGTILLASTTDSIFQTVDLDGTQWPAITSGANTPQNIRINGFTFSSTLDNSQAMLALDCLLDSVIEDCVFQGAAATSIQPTAIELRGQGALTCDNVTIKNCVFETLGTAIASDYDVTNIIITENKFKNINAGILLAETLQESSGPTHIDITNNKFINISNQGVYAGANATGAAFIKSSNNSYQNVGNDITQGDYSQSTDVITFTSPGNFSSGDDFSRLDAINTSSIAGFTSILPIVNGPSIVTPKVPSQVTISGTGDFQVFTYPKISYTLTNFMSPGQQISIDYVLHKTADGVTRRGTISAVVYSNTSTITDNFSYVGPTDGSTTFKLDLSRSDVVSVQANNLGTSGYLIYTPTVSQ